MIKKFLALSALAIFGMAAAQRTYTVKAGDNPTTIARQHNISLNELIRLNPSAKDGKLQIGEVLVISQGKAGSAGTNVQKTSVKTTATGTIVLQPKQTLYGITKQYHISEEEVRKLNPNLQMKVGEEVVLPLENLKNTLCRGKRYALPRYPPPLPRSLRRSPTPTPFSRRTIITGLPSSLALRSSSFSR